MKKIFSFALFLAACFMASSQDEIITLNGMIHKGKVSSVDSGFVIFFRPYSYFESKLPIDSTWGIIFKNGDTVVYNHSIAIEIAIKNHKKPRVIYRTTRYKNPAVAAVCSFLPGLGQMYNDEIIKGIAFMAGTYTTLGAGIGLGLTGHEDVGIGCIIVAAGLYIWSFLDAVVTSDKLNKTNGYIISISPTIINNSLATNANGASLTPGFSLSMRL